MALVQVITKWCFCTSCLSVWDFSLQSMMISAVEEVTRFLTVFWFLLSPRGSMPATNYLTIAELCRHMFLSAFFRHDVRCSVWPSDPRAYISPHRTFPPSYAITSPLPIPGWAWEPSGSELKSVSNPEVVCSFLNCSTGVEQHTNIQLLFYY